MRMVIVNVVNAKTGKFVKRYTEWFYGPCDIRIEDRPRVAVDNVRRKFSRCFPNCNFVHHKGNK